jgi:aromatic ring-opening dioxygenase LigB subunit
VSVSILPHGSMLMDPHQHTRCTQSGQKQFLESVQALVTACQVCAECIFSQRPDLIVVLTPHGASADHDFLLYGNLKASGTCEWEGGWRTFSASCDIDESETLALHQALKQNGCPSQIVTMFAKSRPFPLAWGEVVPLSFLSKFPISARFVFLTFPLRRHEFSPSYQGDLEAVAQVLGAYSSFVTKRVSVISSSDLAHTHPCALTDVSPPFGSLPDGSPEEFDRCIEVWARKTSSRDEKLANAIELFGRHVLTCGMSGIFVVHVLLKLLHLELHEQSFIRKTPTYFGMMVAHFE